MYHGDMDAREANPSPHEDWEPQEDWELLLSFLPRNWQELAVQHGALKGLRKDKSAEHLLRVLLLHFACGHSLQETVVRARQAGLAELSAVALWKRLNKSQDWLHALCGELFRERGVELAASGGPPMRAIDATTIKEPGQTGSLWRLHYSVRLPSLACDYFELTATEGAGTGESLSRIPVQAGDYLLADRGDSTAAGLGRVDAAGGLVTVRVNTGALRFRTAADEPFDLLAAVRTVRRYGRTRSWDVRVIDPRSRPVAGRVCVLRKSGAAIRTAHRALRREASRKGRAVQPQTWEFAKYVIVFTTFPAAEFPAERVLEWYRLRWQVELVFKRFKSLAQLGHLPKHNDDSAKAWLYGKLLVALLVEKLIRYALAFSPWGYRMAQTPPAQRVA